MGVSNRLLFFSRPLHVLLGNPNPNPNPRFLSSAKATPISRTPLEKQFDACVARLGPGFSSADVAAAVRSVSDPDLALDLFRWSALRPGLRHGPDAYLAALSAAVSARRFARAETLIDEILAGAPSPAPDLPLLNTAVHFCCSRRHLFSRAFDLFKLMQKLPHCPPSVETYTMLLGGILRRFGKPPVSFVYLHAVRSLVRQMKASGTIPDTLALNLIIKAYSLCLQMDEAVRVFKEMGLYGCDPNEYTYGYLAKGLCEKGRVTEGFGFYKEMRERGLLPTTSVYMALICSLAMDRRFEEGIETLFDMLRNSRSPDILTYRTLLEGLCREGRADDAFGLLEELGSRAGAMDRRTYSDLLDGLHWLCQPQN